MHGYDYSTSGYYFVTICTEGRRLLLRQPDVRQAVTDAWNGLPTRFPAVRLDAFVVMPNHVHCVIILSEDGGPSLGQAFRAFKSISAIEANRLLGREGQPFWQRNYYERVIRSERELEAVREYIADNPAGWEDDPENPANWHRAAAGAQQAGAPTG
jgi:REP element-mobilizing transposase RayT